MGRKGDERQGENARLRCPPDGRRRVEADAPLWVHGRVQEKPRGCVPSLAPSPSPQLYEALKHLFLKLGA